MVVIINDEAGCRDIVIMHATTEYLFMNMSRIELNYIIFRVYCRCCIRLGLRIVSLYFYNVVSCEQ